MLFMSKQVRLPKISLMLQKMKIGQKPIYALFAQGPSIILETFREPALRRKLYVSKTFLPKNFSLICFFLHENWICHMILNRK